MVWFASSNKMTFQSQFAFNPERVIQVMIEQKKKRVIIPFRPILRWIIRLRRSPRAISGGLALGTFIAFTPTMGIQFAIVIFLATIFNLNRPAALLTIWISNAATMVPLYTFNYYVGTLFWPGPPVSEVYSAFSSIAAELLKLGFFDIKEQVATVMALSTDVFIPLIIGSVVVGIIAALLVFLLSIGLFHLLRIQRERRITRRNNKG